MGFGEILRQTRERKGLDLASTARRMRIRPDILQAIEESNFAKMPPRGYSRNMVNGYARYLGLNATEITGMYLDEFNHYQMSVSSAAQRSSGIDMSAAPQNTRVPHRNPQRRPQSDRANTQVNANNTRARSSEPGRSNAQDTSGARNNRGAQRPGQQRPNRNRMDNLSTSAASKRASERANDRRRDHKNGATGLSSLQGMQRPRGNSKSGLSIVGGRMDTSRAQFNNVYTGGQSIVREKLPYIIAAAVVLVIVLVVCFMLFGGKGKTETSSVPNVPVTGLSNTASDSESDTSSSNSATTKETAPTKFTFSYTVASGSTSWIEVYVDGTAQVAEAVVGPSTKSFDCSGTLEFVCANTTGVTATQDGSPLTLTADSSGIVDMTINFSDVLSKWNAEHPNSASASSQTTTASDSSSTSSANTSTSSSGTSTN